MIGGGRKFVPEGQPPGRVDFTVRFDRETLREVISAARLRQTTVEQTIVEAVQFWLRQTGGER